MDRTRVFSGLHPHGVVHVRSILRAHREFAAGDPHLPSGAGIEVIVAHRLADCLVGIPPISGWGSGFSGRRRRRPTVGPWHGSRSPLPA